MGTVSSLRIFPAALAAWALCASSSIAAPDKPPAEKKQDPAVDAFFDAPPPPKKSSLDALVNASKDVVNREDKALEPKTTEVKDDVLVRFVSIFAAEKIVLDKKLGCQPGGPEKKKVTYVVADEFPYEAVPLSVCLSMQSSVGRPVAVSVAIIDPRRTRIAKAESVVDFTGHADRVDAVSDFPAPVFRMAGPHQYVVEIDGKEAARLPLFDVRVEAR
jgi:hypothetical protein